MNHLKKMIAPIIITVIVVLYLLIYALPLLFLDEVSVIVKILVTVIPLLLSGVMIGVLISRIKEIKGGEEDDLSNY